MASKDKRYYWLKLKRDFFKRHDIQIIESMPNGKDYILFYLKLLCESVDHEGNLRFSEQIPYNENMLAIITNTNIDIVKSAIDIFTQLNMMEIMDDGTYYMSEVNKMMGSETYWAEKKRMQRENKRLIEDNTGIISEEVGQCPICPSKSKRKSIDKDIEIDKDKDKEVKHKHGEYMNVLLTDKELEKLKEEYPDYLQRIENLSNYIASKGAKYKSHYATIRNWARKDKEQQKPKPQSTELDSFYAMASEWADK